MFKNKSPRCSWIKKKSKKVFSSYLQINGIQSFSIDMKSLVDKFGNLNFATLELVADVEEGLTGNIRSGSNEIKYYEREEKLVFMDGANNFKPGLKYTCYVS
jgi:hypothetical protein